MKRWSLIASLLAVVILAGGWLRAWYFKDARAERLHFERGETELVVTNLARVPVQLFKAGRSLREAQPLPAFNGERLWLPAGNYFLKADFPKREIFYPVPLSGYRRGPDADGSFVVTIRSLTDEAPPRLASSQTNWAFIPNGNFLLGERQNPREPHYVWLPAFFIAKFEVSNAEFAEFLNDPRGFADHANWAEAGRVWRAANQAHSTARLKPHDAEFQRFGQPDQPVTGVTWFEAQAYCQWLTRKLGGKHWLFALPSEAEWEKAARGPDSFAYALGRTLSDAEVKLYNWKKNPDAAITVAGLAASTKQYQPNRYGIFHLCGNVVEWTSSITKPFNRERPYVEAERNRAEGNDARVARGGSWYSASIALLQISYRDSFQPEVSHHDLGFRIVARPLP